MSDVDLDLTVEDALRAHSRAHRPAPPPRNMVFVIVCGVVFPIIAIGVEILLRMLTSLVDPIPTAWHLAALVLVPIANLFAYIVYRKALYQSVPVATFVVGMSIGVATVYSVQLAPMTPYFFVGIIILGLGLLGFVPYVAMASSISCARRLAALQPARGLLWIGIAATVLPFAIYYGTAETTRYGLRMASSTNEKTNMRGVRLIRTYGSKSALLRLCYGLPVGFWTFGDIWDNGVSDETREQARKAYYRVTGSSFTSAPRPAATVAARGWMAGAFDFDMDIGGTAVNGRATDVALTSSNMDAVVEPDSLTAYTEWTLLFKNTSELQREARAEIALPHDAAVSRLTLWINGEPREAAFSTRGSVRAAYQEVAVVQRRDPVLVTTRGPDRILLQCFPVPPDGGTMKVRIGISSPLQPEGYSKAVFALPRFVERNFGGSDDLRHVVMMGSRCIELSDDDLAGPKGRIEFSRDPDVRTVWTPDTLEPTRYAIVQTIRQSPAAAPESLVIVVDGSVRMREVRDQIASALHAIPASCRFAVIQASDRLERLSPMGVASPNALSRAEDAIRDARFVGGVDNRPALIAASDMIAQSPSGLILWIHGPQPFTADARTEQLRQISRNRKSLRILAIEAVEGGNSVLADLEETGAIAVVPRNGDLQADLESVLGGWGEPSRLMVDRASVPVGRESGARGSSHIARLWARDEAMRMCRRDTRLAADASQLAAKHQVVTPVSGAVVLERKEQYDRHGLKPVDPKTVPAITPEPATWLVLAVGLGALAAAARRRKDICRRPCK